MLLGDTAAVMGRSEVFAAVPVMSAVVGAGVARATGLLSTLMLDAIFWMKGCG